ncbi:MAG: ATP-binding cassette domain-containing protein, partial [Candidatus Eisenbacteria sp.]|nr:ATP-binding cassette domain-containing protein [Candidatus Eisenbacteria bacterium]
MPALRLDHVCKSFGDHVAVDNVSVEVPTGAIYGFIGPNGAGKTTTLRMIVDIIRPDSGSVEVLGLTDPAAIRSRIGYLPEERGMYKKMRCLEFVAYIGMLKGLSPRDASNRGADLMDRFDLGGWKTASVDALSKGMQQKLQFVSTIVHDPELLILDEPFSGLDPVNLETLKTTLLEYHRKGNTVIFSTHMMEQAERLCDSIFMIHKGRKVLDGSIQGIKADAPRRAVRLNCYGDTAFIKDLSYVSRVREYGNNMEIFMEDGSDPQALLRDVVGRVSVTSFDTSEPSLYDIFLELAGAGREQKIATDG